MDKARNLDLPANPLDELIEGLGGTCKVAEMTGRSMRREKVDGEWTIVARCKEKGSADTVNIQERKDFMSGRSDDTLDTHLLSPLKPSSPSHFPTCPCSCTLSYSPILLVCRHHYPPSEHSVTVVSLASCLLSS
jgi:hypothetical protein